MDGGAHLIAHGVKGKGRSGKSGKSVGAPDIIKADLVDGARLSEHEIFPAHIVEKNIERAGEDAVDACMEKVARGGSVLFEEDAKRMGGIEAFKLRNPEGGKRRVERRLDSGTIELFEQVLRRVIGEASVDGDELLVQDGCAEEASQLLFFPGVARESQGVANPGKNETGDAALEGLKKGQLALFKRDDQVALAKLDAICGRNGVDVLGIEAESIEGSEEVARRGIRGSRGRATEEKKGEQSEENAHLFSVVTFGIGGQGERLSIGSQD